MSKFVTIETPGGTVWAEVENPGATGIELNSARGQKAIKSFEDTVQALKENADYMINALKELELEEIEVSCGVKIGAETSTPFFALAKASGEASYTITVKWKAKKNRDNN